MSIWNKKEKVKPCKLKSFPNLENRLDIMSDEKLLELGYIILQEVFLVLRKLPKEEPELSLFWCERFSVAAHNIPLKLKSRDTTFFKEEIMKVVTYLFNYSEELKEKGYFNDTIDRIDNFIDSH